MTSPHGTPGATPPTARTRVRRLPDRGRYDRSTIDAILDAGIVCHVGLAVDGAPVVLPVLYARDGDDLLLHGSQGSQLLRHAAGGAPLCVTVIHLDGLVLARSAFHHSVNYRSVVVFGHAEQLTGAAARRALEVLTDHVVPGRWSEARAPSRKELAATAVLRLSLDEASAKVRTGGPADDPEDLDLPVWAGVVPIRQVAGAPLPAPDLRDDTPLPAAFTPGSAARTRWLEEARP